MIEPCGDLKGYFEDRLDRALGQLQLSPIPETRVYLLDLLSTRALAGQTTMEETLVDRLAGAMAANDPKERFRRYRDTGDSALYTSGFFGEHLDGRGLSRDYVKAMGGRAYLAAAELSGSSRHMYGELAHGFEQFARAIDEVREATTMRTPQDIVKLYDRWRKTRSPKIAERLRSEGVFPQDNLFRLH